MRLGRGCLPNPVTDSLSKKGSPGCRSHAGDMASLSVLTEALDEVLFPFRGEIKIEYSDLQAQKGGRKNEKKFEKSNKRHYLFLYFVIYQPILG